MRRGTRVFSIALLAVLIVVNLLLLFLLFRPNRILIVRPAISSASASGDQTASVSPNASTYRSSSTPTIEAVPVERLLLAMSSKTAWRATVGDCNTPGEIERSTDGGASWERVVRTGPAPIVRLGEEPSGDLFTIGGTRASCSVRYVAYADDGTVNASSTSAVNVWFSSPNDRDQINGPSGTKATPCNGHVIDLAPFSLTQALAICESGDAMSTGNSGKTWRQVARIPNTLAVAAGSGRYWVAGVHEDCDGVTVQSLAEKNGGATRGRTRCAAGLDVAGGQVAIDVTGDTIWLWSGNKIAISRDDGETWQ